MTPGRGRISCGFNATIYPDTLNQVPMLTRWAQSHMDVVHTMVYILFRQAKFDPQFDYFVGGRRIDPEEASRLRYLLGESSNYRNVMTREVVDLIREANPEYEPCAFLNSSLDGKFTQMAAGNSNRPVRIRFWAIWTENL